MAMVLSIQSSVAYGHVGNSAATFPLMRMGLEVWPVLTVHFSNHTGYPSWRGPLLAASDIAEVVQGIDERGVLGRSTRCCPATRGRRRRAGDRWRRWRWSSRATQTAIYCCDPVMGDVGRGLYVRPGIPELMRTRVVPAARRSITPNQFELEFADRPVRRHPGGGAGRRRRGSVPWGRGSCWSPASCTTTRPAAPSTWSRSPTTGPGRDDTPLLAQSFTGAGDLTAATSWRSLLTGGDLPLRWGGRPPSCYGVLERDRRPRRVELQLVAAQDELCAPPTPSRSPAALSIARSPATRCSSSGGHGGSTSASREPLSAWNSGQCGGRRARSPFRIAAPQRRTQHRGPGFTASERRG